MSAITINGVNLDLDLMELETAEKVEKSIENVEKGAAAIEADKTMKLSAGIRATCTMIFNCFNEVFGAGTDKKVFGNRTNMTECMGAFAELCQQTVKQPQSTLDGLVGKYSPNRAQRRHTAGLNTTRNAL